MKKTNKKAFFIVYAIKENDIINMYDSDKLKDCADWCGIDYTNINKYVIKSLEDIEKIRKKEEKQQYIEKNNYFIFKDYE